MLYEVITIAPAGLERGGQRGGIAHLVQRAGRGKSCGNLEEVEQVRPAEQRLAQRRRLQQVVSAEGNQTAADEGNSYNFV